MKNFTQIVDFARHFMGKPLYPYQLEIAEAILASIDTRQGNILEIDEAQDVTREKFDRDFRPMARTRSSIVMKAHINGAA